MTSHYQLQSLKQLLLVGSLMLVSLFATAADKVVVLTSYPQEVVSQFEISFEREYPQYKLEVLWKQSRDALDYLHLPAQGAADVYWSPAQRNFTQLKNEHAFQKLETDTKNLPTEVAGYTISDKDSFYAATEIAGFGMAVNPGKLAQSNIALPQDWQDLTSPQFRNQVVMPIPSKVGFSPALYDTLLQGYGWELGWALITKMAANAKLADSGSTFITDDVGRGQFMAGLTIDFFAVSAIANGAPLQFIYPKIVGYSPAHIAILRDSPNPEGAKAFSNFVVSESGQKLLFHPDIQKLPARPSVYQYKPNGYFNPFEQKISVNNWRYDTELALKRQNLVAALFDARITRHHAILKEVWQSIEKAKQQVGQNNPRLLTVIKMAEMQILTESQANDADLQKLFSQKDDKNVAAQKIQEAEWDTQIQKRYQQVIELTHQLLLKQ
ncbi:MULTISPECIES: ABC transporter substrate-binding protein [Methylotenera]|uniref:ABC transporter substrate-binding protein n=1 Tax=Methylotenera TaxID=359407 RepID=UPI000365479B|nr:MULTISPECIES: extracellular solute-binding protein [Methylotenera]